MDLRAIEMSEKKKSNHKMSHIVAAWMEGLLGREWMHVYVWLSPCAVHLKLSPRC